MALRALVAPLALAAFAGCASHESRVESMTRRSFRLAGSMIHRLQESKGRYPDALGVWGELRERNWLIGNPPCFQIVHDPHYLLVFDYWEQPIRYEVVSGDVVLTSGGPNGRIGDADDLIEVIRPGSD